ncbi:MAG: hypothetical protein COZ37_06735 [bacterium (Candidatus Ratteibacteria) CG_4_10_14_3_um_filter_41_18]|uniref:Uncharacterized protein n=4 Tax=Candidatus Ratteibacteria TaxID=2979319 RepID=A0A2M7YFA4_9BACT|nr:MAG: hypothetical protein AUJ76_03630 [Candidatus Omnitrophica bacterium CG1_02_41_171]PIV63582.1 MAG: hypothetical protein COS11_06740 [bacterium (Candidatus Ratteibacteria) CG01_land_8_20_14_3_00_40_19]PIW34155.1 MAG: hypothetical protein COW28_00710 [bacterium (Candidatus Ratteibacteria) CG15_BIG_FIL_POST_REV_8_21_14_020_41_12]PIW74463.1 MAG: hypothetical protein CO004_00535 [bacterium (Candidatus Ratteibacteria) CG_4_8_14_3_um_filter_41_36]PIX76670.1 MAG: hypothetical protein COZ37_06735
MAEKIPDRRALEKTTSDLTRLLKRKHFSSKKELDNYLNQILNKGKVPDAPPKSAVDFAQDIMYEAWDTDDAKERIKLAREALSISPDCADAYVLLAEEEAETLEEAKEFYQKGVEAGERALGEKTFDEDRGHFWGVTETRPYMRARAGLAQCLYEMGEYDEAIAQYREMLELNPNDNQGIRYVLACYLAELGRYNELEEHLNSKEYKDDCAPDWLYTKALLSFVRDGDSAQSRAKFKAAAKWNPYVPEYITGKRSIPRILPDTVRVGGEDEAMCYAADSLSAWRRVPGAIEWLKEQAGIRTHSKVGRNDPCPCGSGKKYKKCCGR